MYVNEEWISSDYTLLGHLWFASVSSRRGNLFYENTLTTPCKPVTSTKCNFYFYEYFYRIYPRHKGLLHSVVGEEQRGLKHVKSCIM